MASRRWNYYCAVWDCRRPVVARALCGLHYTRWKRHGSPFVVGKRGRKPKPKQGSP